MKMTICVVPQVEPIERVEQSADLGVHVADGGVVGTDRVTALLVAEAIVRRG